MPPFFSHRQLPEAVCQLPSKIHYPIHLDASTVKGKFTFRPPVAVKVTGSYLLKTAIKPDLNVDLALHIPEVRLHSTAHRKHIHCFGWLTHLLTQLAGVSAGKGSSQLSLPPQKSTLLVPCGCTPTQEEEEVWPEECGVLSISWRSTCAPPGLETWRLAHSPSPSPSPSLPLSLSPSPPPPSPST